MATAETTETPDSIDEGEGRGPSLTTLVGAVVALCGLLVGLAELSDSSFLTHLATGRLILDSGSVPTADPYSFTAPGTDWTVQSWLASALYAGVEDLFGLSGVRVLFGLLCAALAALVWRLSEPAGALALRVGLVLPVLLIGTEAWDQRPLLFGLLGLAAVHLLADGRGRAWWAVPVLWVWVNTHGSFPLGVGLVGALWLGRLVDRRPARRELEVLGWSALGGLLGAVNPLGPRLLVFPVELLGRADTLRFIKEWRAPDYGDLAPRVLLLQVALAVGALVVGRRRFRSVLPLVVFVGLAVTSARNVAPASIVVLGAMAPAVRGLVTDRGPVVRPWIGPVRVAVVVLAVLAVASAFRRPAADLTFYPEAAVDWMEAEGLTGPDARIVSRDFAGNYLEARYGTETPVFIDDRYDMFPTAVVDDYRALFRGDDDWPAIVGRWDAQAILWTRDTPLGDRLEDGPDGWRVAYEDQYWLVAVPA